MKVLVIEDDPGIIEVVSLCFQLRWSGTTVISAPNGRDGVELVESESPDVVILDIGLPDMDGYQVLKEIRRFADVPVLMLTVRGEDTDVAPCSSVELDRQSYHRETYGCLFVQGPVRTFLAACGRTMQLVPCCLNILSPPQSRQVTGRRAVREAD